MGNLIIALVAVVFILGGPFTIYFLIKLLNSAWGSPKVKFVKTDIVENGHNLLGLLVTWDEELEAVVSRVKCEFYELVRGGRSANFSFTFEDNSAKKRSFLIPMKLEEADYQKLIDGGLPGALKGSFRSYLSVELENPQGETLRIKISKNKIRQVLSEPVATFGKDVEVMPATAPDAWSVMTRVFPWRAAAAAEAEANPAPAGGHAAKPKAADGPKAVVNFDVTKVWIEPGCIVCDACENEAPLVFQVLADTCIVRENAPLDDGGAIKAAAEGCPVNVIKFTTVAKSA